MKKLLFTLSLTLLLCFVLVGAVSARTVYLEEIPEELKATNDSKTHFVVIEDEKYYAGSGSTIDGLNESVIAEDLKDAGIDASLIGKSYLTRLNVPATLNGTTVTYVNLNAMKGKTYVNDSVTGYVQLAGTVKQIHDMNQHVGQLRGVDFGENSQITSIPSHFANQARQLRTVKNFPRNLTYIGPNSFNNAIYAFEGVLYISAETISDGAFNNAITYVTGIVFGPNVKNIGKQVFSVRSSETSLGDARAKFIEFQCPVSTLSLWTLGNDSGSFYFAPKSGNPRSPYSSLQCIVISNEADLALIEANGYTTIQELNTNICFDENYSNTFVTAHNYTYTYSYESLASAGAKTGTCSCGATVVEALPAIFECYGYSIATYGEGAITVGFRVDLKALTAYEEMLGYTVSFGIVAAGAENLGGKSPLDENGNAIALENGLVIKAELDRANALFDGKVIGLSTESQKSTQLIMCGYAHITDGEGNTVSVSYLQKADTEALASTSYNDLLAVNK